MGSALQITHLSSRGLLVLLKKCASPCMHAPLPSPLRVCVHAWVRILHIHPHACMISVELHPLPEGLDLAGVLDGQQPTCLIIPLAHSRSQTLQQMHVRPQELMH